jgi:hypothetical protein
LKKSSFVPWPFGSTFCPTESRLQRRRIEVGAAALARAVPPLVAGAVAVIACPVLQLVDVDGDRRIVAPASFACRRAMRWRWRSRKYCSSLLALQACPPHLLRLELLVEALGRLSLLDRLRRERIGRFSRPRLGS